MLKKKTRIARGVKSLKGIEKKYQKQLNKLGRSMVKSVKETVLAILKKDQPEYVMDGVASELDIAFKALSNIYLGTPTDIFAGINASKMVASTTIANRNKFSRSIKAATGVDLTSMVATEGLQSFMDLSISKNVSLIKSLPEEYLKQVETIVNNGVINGTKYKEIERQILARTGSPTSKLAGRIKTIARNEVSTINSQLTLRRSDSLGIEKGIYRTSEDDRVRPCHAELDGKEFEISKGAWSPSCGKFIQPGITDINCRCFYSPIIEVENVTA